MDRETIIVVLEVVAEFEPLEPAGVSAGLVAWELDQTEQTIEPVIHHARENGMIERVGWDRDSGERLWRLTPHGRARLATAEG
jgi:hypothetical protein